MCWTSLVSWHFQPVSLSDDYNRVLLKLDEGHSHDSVQQDEDDEDEEESSDEEDEESTKYINASHIDVRNFPAFCLIKAKLIMFLLLSFLL